MHERILLVDDDASVRESLAKALTSEGYLPLVARHGEEAVEIATTVSVDLIVLDIGMPVLGGWDAFERMTTEHPEVPVIVLTGRPNQLFTSLAAGVGALLEKPVDLRVLLQTIQRLLSEPMEERLARLTGASSALYYYAQETQASNRPRSDGGSRPITGG
jgi:DNA-binding response OmpR family regulator